MHLVERSPHPPARRRTVTRRTVVTGSSGLGCANITRWRRTSHDRGRGAPVSGSGTAGRHARQGGIDDWHRAGHTSRAFLGREGASSANRAAYPIGRCSFVRGARGAVDRRHERLGPSVGTRRGRGDSCPPAGGESSREPQGDLARLGSALADEAALGMSDLGVRSDHRSASAQARLSFRAARWAPVGRRRRRRRA